MEKQTLIGPRGVKLILDPSEIFPDDPGSGTPALVEYKEQTGTYWCALGEGEVCCDKVVKLPVPVLDWLENQRPLVERMFEEHSRGGDA